jgi:hypothetical protein
MDERYVRKRVVRRRQSQVGEKVRFVDRLAPDYILAKVKLA